MSATILGLTRARVVGMRVDILSIDGSHVIGWGTVLGQLEHPADPNVGSCQAPDLPYVVQEDRLQTGVLSLFHGSRLAPCGSDTVLTDSDVRW